MITQPTSGTTQNAAFKAYQRMRETVEDVGLEPLRGEGDRALRRVIHDYFDHCEAATRAAREKAAGWNKLGTAAPNVINKIGIAIFAGLFVGLGFLEVELLHNTGFHVF